MSRNTIPEQMSYELRLEQLELEVKRQQEQIEQIGSRLGSQNESLMSLQASVALIVATWHGEIGRGLNEISRQIADCSSALTGL